MQDHVLIGGFIWSPSLDEDQRIQKGWNRCTEAVSYRMEAPRERDQLVVHVGSKGRDSADLEELTTGEFVAKQCLCFDKSFVEELLDKYGP